jgi:hypothetical protein
MMKKLSSWGLRAAWTISTALLVTAPGTSQKSVGLAEDETAGNNLSVPVVWSDRVGLPLRGSPDDPPVLLGDWWYWWGTESATGSPLSCRPDPDDMSRCDDGVPGRANGPMPGASLPGAEVFQAFLQKDEFNVWQAWNDYAQGRVLVDWIDWGDNLEARNWNLRSQVRTEVVLLEDLRTNDSAQGGWEPVGIPVHYSMRHTAGWGATEMHGLAVMAGVPQLELGTEATVYSHSVRFVIQKLNIRRDDPRTSQLYWGRDAGWVQSAATVGRLVEPPMYDGRVWQSGDGPGFYKAEINIKGRVIYGYTWDVRNMNQGPGDYRLTFALEQGPLAVPQNTFFHEDVTAIVPFGDEETTLGPKAGGGGGGGGGGGRGGTGGGGSPQTGARAQIDYKNNLTYIDVRITSGG